MLLKRGAVLIALFVSSVLSASACSVVQEGAYLSSQEAITDGTSATPEKQRYATNYTWHKSDGFDPTSSLGTFVRAYVESMLRMLMDGGKSALFPGAEDATKFDTALLERVAIDHPVGPSGRRGAKDLHVLAVNETDSGSEVIVCEDPSGVAEKIGNGQWQARGTETHTRVRISRLVIDNVGDSPPSNVVGTAQYPPESVFGDWKALEYQPMLGLDSAEGRGIDFESRCLVEIGKERTPSSASDPIVPEPPVEAPSPVPGWPEGEPN